MSLIFSLGILAGIIQIIGYIFYILKTNRNDISPNPTTWLIFAFDTTILTALEAIAGADVALLFLPFMCSIGAIYIAWLVRKAGRLHWPTDPFDAYILKVGIFIACAYTVLFILWHFAVVPTTMLHAAGFLFLVLTNINTFVAFIPILREVKHDPLHEHAGPWTIWTAAYVLLGVVTYLEVGFERDGLIFYVYPVSCAILHGAIAVLARDVRKKKFIISNDA